MIVAIIDSCFPLNKQESQGLAAKYLHWDCKKNNIKTIITPANADYIFMTCVSPMGRDYAKRLKKYNIPIIAGGVGTDTPVAFGEYVDAVVLGDGQKFITEFSKSPDQALKGANIWKSGLYNLTPDYNFPWDMPYIQAEDKAYRIWLGRGCKKKCAFCHTGWGQEYSQAPDLNRVISYATSMVKKNKKIAYLTNDLMAHDLINKLPMSNHASLSLSYMKKNGVPPVRQVRLGIEGVSERLRKAISKPINYEDLVKSAVWLGSQGKSTRWFMIAGLPYENETDWDELKSTILDWKRLSIKGVLELSFTSWIPSPSTPIGCAPLTDDYYNWFSDFKEWFFSGPGWSNRIKLYNPAMPKTRNIHAEYYMAMPIDKLRNGGSYGPNYKAVNYRYKHLQEKSFLSYRRKLKATNVRKTKTNQIKSYSKQS